MKQSAALWAVGFVFCSVACGGASTPRRTAASEPNTHRYAPPPKPVSGVSEAKAEPATPVRKAPVLPTAKGARVTEAVVHVMTNDVDLARHSVESEDFVSALRKAGAVAPPSLVFIDGPRVTGSDIQGPLKIWVGVEETPRTPPGQVATTYHWLDWEDLGKRLDEGAAIVIQVASDDVEAMMRFLQSGEFEKLLRQSGVEETPRVQEVDRVVFGAFGK